MPSKKVQAQKLSDLNVKLQHRDYCLTVAAQKRGATLQSGLLARSRITYFKA